MSFKITQSRHNLFLVLLSMMLVLVCTGCGAKSGTTAEKPHPGKWTAEFSTKAGEQDKHWVIDFLVSDDGKTVSRIQLAHYLGELNADTQVTVLLSGSKPSIDNNSFKVTIPEFYNYSSHTYEGEVKFISENQADGTFKIDGTEYKCTAALVSQ